MPDTTTTIATKDVLTPILSFLIGVLTAWLTFELTERRRRRMARKAFRSGLLEELRYAEVLLCVNALKFAETVQAERDVARMAKEARWYLTVGRARAKDKRSRRNTG